VTLTEGGPGNGGLPDGAGFTCYRVDRIASGTMGAEDVNGLSILNVHLLWETARSLRLLGRHAVGNTGAWGDALVVASLIGKNLTLSYMHQGMLEIGVTERGFDGPIESRHTLLLDSVAGADQELLASTRIVASDHFNALGSPEITQIDPEGRIRSRYVKRDQRFLSFVEECGVELSDERVQSVA